MTAKELIQKTIDDLREQILRLEAALIALQ